MDRQCGRQLYDRTCCAKQMWERLRRPMNTKQSLGRNPTSFCARSWEAAQPAPTLMGTPCRCLGLAEEGIAPLPLPLPLRWSPQLPSRVRPQPEWEVALEVWPSPSGDPPRTHTLPCFPCHSHYSLLDSSQALTCLGTAVRLPLLPLRFSSSPPSRQLTTLPSLSFHLPLPRPGSSTSPPRPPPSLRPSPRPPHLSDPFPAHLPPCPLPP